MALSPVKKEEMLAGIVSICAQFEKLGLSIVDQYDCGHIDGRTAGATHDILLEAMAALVEVQTAIESSFEPGPESKQLDGVLVVYEPGSAAIVVSTREYLDKQDLHRLHNDAPSTAEPERLPPIRDDELPGWDDVTYDSPNN